MIMILKWGGLDDLSSSLYDMYSVALMLEYTIQAKAKSQGGGGGVDFI